ncbi:MAG: zinc-ribbon domain-containing protein [Clostridia bacterium]|nr:zinc-ribbon domain-containing protein [Clostridia bacterium]
MICTNCGSEINAGTNFCTVCGTKVEEAPMTLGQVDFTEQTVNEEPVFIQPVRQEEKPEKKIPEKYSPLGPWTYFWLQVLFAVPIVGFVFLIVFSFNDSNINRRNFARSYWCKLIIAAGVFLVTLIIALVFGFSLRSAVLMDGLGGNMYSL